MKNRNIVLAFYFGLALSLILIDQWTKTHVSYLNLHLGSWINFYESKNTGIALGYLKDISSFINVVGVNTLGAVLVLFYLSFFYLNGVKNIFLNIGAIFILSGIVGNWYDRFFRHYVIDFLVLNISKQTQIVFNLADVFIWIGFFIVLYRSNNFDLVYSKILSLKKNENINIKLQSKITNLLILLGLKTGFTLFVFSYSFLKVVLAFNQVNIGAELENKILNIYWLSFVSTLTVISLFYAVTARLMSKHISGQIFAFERYINQIISDDFNPQSEKANFTLRKNDELKNLEFVADRILFKLKNQSVLNQNVQK